MQPRIKSAVLAVLALGAALPALALGLTAQVEAAPSATFAAPREPLVLTRTVWRTLHDGQQIVTRRSFLQTFASDEDGFLVTGQQIAVEVEVPPALEPIARLERSRVETGAFPLHLDSAGMIRSSSPAGSSARPDGEAAGRALLAGSSLAAADQREAETLLASLAIKGGAVPWPLDLFNPREPSRIDRREVTLPDGSSGLLTVTLSVEPSRIGGLPAKVSREILSDLGGTRRVSREEWTFAPRTGP